MGQATKDWGKTRTLDPLGSWTYRLFFKMICVCFAHVNEFVLTQSVSFGHKQTQKYVELKAQGGKMTPFQVMGKYLSWY